MGTFAYLADSKQYLPSRNRSHLGNWQTGGHSTMTPMNEMWDEGYLKQRRLMVCPSRARVRGSWSQDGRYFELGAWKGGRSTYCFIGSTVVGRGLDDTYEYWIRTSLLENHASLFFDSVMAEPARDWAWHQMTNHWGAGMGDPLPNGRFLNAQGGNAAGLNGSVRWIPYDGGSRWSAGDPLPPSPGWHGQPGGGSMSHIRVPTGTVALHNKAHRPPCNWYYFESTDPAVASRGTLAPWP